MAKREFKSTDHLNPEAVAAFVDGELGMSAHARAAHHLALCPECVAAVEAQSLARTRLRESGRVSIPDSLLGQLSQIPTREIDLSSEPPRPAGFGPTVSPDAPTDGIPAARGRAFRRRGR